MNEKLEFDHSFPIKTLFTADNLKARDARASKNISGTNLRLIESWTKLSREERRKEGKEYKKKNISCQDSLRLFKTCSPHREQQRQVSKVLLDGLYDPDSPISKLLGVRTEVMGEIIWQELIEK